MTKYSNTADILCLNHLVWFSKFEPNGRLKDQIEVQGHDDCPLFFIFPDTILDHSIPNNYVLYRGHRIMTNFPTHFVNFNRVIDLTRELCPEVNLSNSRGIVFQLFAIRDFLVIIGLEVLPKNEFLLYSMDNTGISKVQFGLFDLIINLNNFTVISSRFYNPINYRVPYYCHICNMFLSKENVNRHIIGVSHNKKFQSSFFKREFKDWLEIRGESSSSS